MKILFKNTEEPWRRILVLMYENQMIVDNFDNNSLDDLTDSLNNSKIIKEKTDLSSEEISKVVNYLEKANFVQDTSLPITLTENGFHMAHQIKTERQRRNTNIILVVLTIILTVLTVGLLGVELAPIFISG